MSATGCTEMEYYLTGKGNFRHEIGTILVYKGTRKADRPYHYRNMMNYLQWKYNAVLVQGMEADDMLSIRQYQEQDNSCIVSRDKDLRMNKGWHYAYGVTNQPEKPLEHISELGYLTLKKKAKTSKLIGGGLRWFYAQCLMGDRVDNIQGVPQIADVKAYKILEECKDEAELYARTLETYTQYYDDEAVGYASMQENAQLLWMVRSLDEDKNPVMWRMHS